jgi:hypothetical protein
VKPLPPVKPQEKLPLTYHLTIVKDPEKGSRVISVVGTTMQGDEVVARKVFGSFEDKQEAMDELNRKALKAFYFEDPDAWETL